MDVAGLRCVVTGAASGIGAAVARRLIAGGAEVTTLDVRHPVVPATKHVACDLSDPAAVERAVADLGSGWHVLCNVAGIPGDAADDVVLRTNFLGPRMLTEGLLPGFAEGGSIVNVASTNGVKWRRRLPEILSFLATGSVAEGVEWYAAKSLDGPAYSFSKEAMIVYSMTLSERSRSRRIRVNSVSPGATDTPLMPGLRATLGPAKLARVAAVTGRYASPDEIAPAIVFLSSRESGWINGHNLVVDDGYLSGRQFRR